MKVTTIDYSESQENVNSIGLKSWKKLRMEAELEEGDILQTSVAVLKEYVKGMIMDEEEVAELAESIGKTNGHTVQPKDERIQSFIELVNSKYQTKKTLENLRPEIEKKNNPELTEAFLTKLRTFDDKKE